MQKFYKMEKSKLDCVIKREYLQVKYQQNNNLLDCYHIHALKEQNKKS